MATRLRPLGTRIIVRPDDPETRSKGGIIIPDTAKQKPATGTVVAMGPGMLMKTGGRWPMPDVSEGDKVIYLKYAGTEMKIEGVVHLVVRDDDLIVGGPEGKMKPLGDRVLVRVDKAEEKSVGGIIIPDIAREKPLAGEVVAIGNGKAMEDGTIRPLDVKVGERVNFSKHSGTAAKVNGEPYTIFREDDFLGVIETV